MRFFSLCALHDCDFCCWCCYMNLKRHTQTCLYVCMLLWMLLLLMLLLNVMYKRFAQHWPTSMCSSLSAAAFLFYFTLGIERNIQFQFHFNERCALCYLWRSIGHRWFCSCCCCCWCLCRCWLFLIFFTLIYFLILVCVMPHYSCIWTRVICYYCGLVCELIISFEIGTFHMHLQFVVFAHLLCFCIVENVQGHSCVCVCVNFAQARESAGWKQTRERTMMLWLLLLLACKS